MYKEKTEHLFNPRDVTPMPPFTGISARSAPDTLCQRRTLKTCLRQLFYIRWYKKPCQIDTYLTGLFLYSLQSALFYMPQTQALPFASLLYRYARIPRRSAMACRGHLTAHMPQLKQRDSLITAWLSITWIASAVQVFSQIPQPIQLTGQASLASFPLSSLAHRTTI